MDISQITVVGNHLTPVPRAEVDALARALGISLPTGYVDFVQAFGAGVYCDLFRIYPPARVLETYQAARRRWQDYFFQDAQGKSHWFFEGSEALLTPEQVQQGFLLGDTIDGDEIVWVPPEAGQVYILPRHSATIATVRSDFDDLHLWDGARPPLRLFHSSETQQSIARRSTEFHLDRSTWLARLRAAWGADGVLIFAEDAQAARWTGVIFVLAIGGRVQVLQNVGAPGQERRLLSVRIDCDADRLPEASAFLDALAQADLVRWAT